MFFNKYKKQCSLYETKLLEKLAEIKVLRSELRELQFNQCDKNTELKKLKDKVKSLKTENKRFNNEIQKLYDCIELWYNPTDDMTKVVEETRKVLESFYRF